MAVLKGMHLGAAGCSQPSDWICPNPKSLGGSYKFCMLPKPTEPFYYYCVKQMDFFDCNRIYIYLLCACCRPIFAKIGLITFGSFMYFHALRDEYCLNVQWLRQQLFFWHQIGLVFLVLHAVVFDVLARHQAGVHNWNGKSGSEDQRFKTWRQ